jgi:hypothetical protein
MTDRWYGFVLARETDGTTSSVLMTECDYCWALVLETRYPRHLATHESQESRLRNANEASPPKE